MKKHLFVVIALLAFGCTKSTGNKTPQQDVVTGDIAADNGNTDAEYDSCEEVLIADDDIAADNGSTDPGDVAGDEGMAHHETTTDVFEIEDVPPPPGHLPFKLTRPDKGKPLTQKEIQNFSYKISGLWKDIHFFRWVNWNSHGMNAVTGKPDYQVWWQDVDAIKKDGVVTFWHGNAGGAHNIGIPTAKVLSQAMAAYILTGNKYAGIVAEQYCKGLTATMKGMVWDKNDPNIYLMARNIVNQNYEVTLEGGRKKKVDYSHWYNTYETWNAQRLHFPHNPYWGDIYVTNMRSKDDVCHIYRTAAFLPYFLKEVKDPKIKAACQETFTYLKGFAKDIVDHNYHIRTKDAQGKAYIPDQDLASFVDYIKIDPKAECTARLASALLAYGDERDVTNCGSGYGSIYEKVAVASHYFNYAIINTFHLAALALALTMGRYATARGLLVGLVDRINHYMHPDKNEPGAKNEYWKSDNAVFLLESASLGLPLTSEEARQIQTYYSNSVDAYKNWPRWDMWASSVPDGTYPYHNGFLPKHTPDTVSIENIAFLLEYCNSPFKNPAGVSPVDCSIISDMSKWGGPKAN